MCYSNKDVLIQVFGGIIRSSYFRSFRFSEVTYFISLYQYIPLLLELWNSFRTYRLPVRCRLTSQWLTVLSAWGPPAQIFSCPWFCVGVNWNKICSGPVQTLRHKNYFVCCDGNLLFFNDVQARISIPLNEVIGATMEDIFLDFSLWKLLRRLD